MIGMTIIMSTVIVLILFALIIFIRELINTIRDYGIGKLEIFYITASIALVIGVVLHNLGI